MYENEALQEAPEPPAGPPADSRVNSSHPGSATSSSGGRGSAEGYRLGSGSGMRAHSPTERRAASPSAHRPGGLSPRRVGSSAGVRAGSAAAVVAVGSPRGADSPRTQGQQQSEVRRVKPREAFGEDEVTAHTTRQQTAVSTGASKQTFGPASGSTSSRGPSAGGASSTASSGGAPTTGPARSGESASSSPAGSSGGAPPMLATGAAAAAAADPHKQCVLLVLSAEDYGAALEGRLTSLLEEKVRCRTGHMRQGRSSATQHGCDLHFHNLPYV
jgi:hypothetical protein